MIQNENGKYEDAGFLIKFDFLKNKNKKKNAEQNKLSIKKTCHSPIVKKKSG